MIAWHMASGRPDRILLTFGVIAASATLCLSGCSLAPPTEEIATEFADIPSSPPPTEVVEVPVYVDLLENPSPSGFPENQLDAGLKLAEETLGSILLIALDEVANRGTGWLVSPRHVVTNWHVVEFALEEEVPLYDSEGNKHFGRVVAFGGPGRDLAVIELATPLAAAPLKILPRPVDPGTPVVSTGHSPRIGAWSSKGGVVVNYPRPTEILYTIPIAPGDSGSPIITLEGNVVGVVSGLNFDDGDLPIEEPTIHTFMPPRDNGQGPTAELLIDFLKTNNIPFELSD